jgi:hypothetical protein
MTGDAPTVDELRHRIDNLTPILPEQMSRTEVATLMMSMQLQGMAIAIAIAGGRPFTREQALMSASELLVLSDGLIGSLGGDWVTW